MMPGGGPGDGKQRVQGLLVRDQAPGAAPAGTGRRLRKHQDAAREDRSRIGGRCADRRARSD